MSTEEQQKQQGDDNNKVVKAYGENVKKLIALMGGPNNESSLKLPTKVANDEIAGLVEKLFKDEKEQQEKDLMTALKELLKKKVEMERAFVEKQKELDRLKIEKFKEFNQSATAFFNKIQNINEIQKTYYTGLQSIIAVEEGTVQNAPVSTTTDDKTKKTDL